MRYKKNMARPTKYSQKLAEKLIDFISNGLTIKDACKGCDVSVDSFSRWRKQHPDLNRRVIESSGIQWKNAESLAKYGYRPYKRNQSPTAAKYGKPLLPQIIPQLKKKPTFIGLPIKDEYPTESRKTDPYFNRNSRQIEWIDKRGVFHSCSLTAYKKKQAQKYDDPFLIL